VIYFYLNFYKTPISQVLLIFFLLAAGAARAHPLKGDPLRRSCVSDVQTSSEMQIFCGAVPAFHMK